MVLPQYLTLAYQVQYKQGNTSPAGGTITTSSTKPTTISGLSPNTTYAARAREICSAGDTSGWSNFTVFTTQCSFYTAPFQEDFEANSWDPAGTWNVQGDQINVGWIRVHLRSSGRQAACI